MKKIKNNIITLLQILTVFSLTSLILYRFRIRIPREIFINPSYYYLYLYSFIFIINIIVFIILFLAYKEFTVTRSRFTEISMKIKTWIEDSYDKLMTLMAEIPGNFSIILAYMTHYYLKIPLIILQIVNYIPRILLCIVISFDVFYLEKFHYSYLFIYLLLLTLTSKAALYISIEINNRLLQEIFISIEMINPDQTIKNYYDETITMIKVNEFQLTSYNKEFESIEHALSMNHVVVNELKSLENIQNKLETPLRFTLLIRGFYVIVFGYIVIKYPLWF